MNTIINDLFAELEDRMEREQVVLAKLMAVQQVEISKLKREAVKLRESLKGN